MFLLTFFALQKHLSDNRRQHIMTKLMEWTLMEQPNISQKLNLLDQNLCGVA